MLINIILKGIITIILCQLLLLHYSECSLLEAVSFEPPFDEHDRFGDRFIGKPNMEFREYGNCVVNKNFIRLTPDRQSKRGAIWSSKPIASQSFATELKFRISGQGKQFFGDGLGLFFTQQSTYTEGNLHGSEEKFTGVSVIIDTYNNNNNNNNNHRDVLVLINNNNKTLDTLINNNNNNNIKGCFSKLRYHNERDDFNINKASKLKIIVNSNEFLSVMVDENNDDNYKTCVNISNLSEFGLDPNWALTAHIGLSATTGALADNHDVLSLLTYPSIELLEAAKDRNNNIKLYEISVNKPTPMRLLKLEETMNEIYEKLDLLNHHIEHEFASIDDHIKVMSNKINIREDKSETRIINLEDIVKKQVNGKLTERLNFIEEKLHTSVDFKLSNVEELIDKKMEKKIDTISKTTTNIINTKQIGNGNWKIPFAILLLLFIAVAITFYQFYEKLRRSHIL